MGAQNKKKRTIAVFTGKRGGFGALISTLEAIEADPMLSFKLLVTDMHLSTRFGKTETEVKKWFSVAHRISLGEYDDTPVKRAEALGRCYQKMVKVLSDIKPDILLVLGDRGEVLAAAYAATELNIPVAHILGGDVAGNLDGNRIHAITKLSHIHFPSNRDAYKRILKLGEEEWRVHNVGSSYLDLVREGRHTPNSEARARYGLSKDEPYAMLIQHPVTLQEKESFNEMKAILQALKKDGIRTIVSYPCSDPGYTGVIRAIEMYAKEPQFIVHKNIEAVDFWGLMAGATFFIGNSSSGLMETPYFSLPAVNVGSRQEGRVRDKNVIDAKATLNDITRAIKRAKKPSTRKTFKNKYLFGRALAGPHIARVLKEVPLGYALLRKKVTF